MTGGILGSMRNKVGSIVAYRSKGQDIARSLAANIANPRTESQQGQRVRLANLVNFYKANAAWMQRYAFVNRPTKWSVYNAFVSANIGGTAVYLTKQEAAQGVAIVAPYKVTSGTIPSVQHSLQGGNVVTDLYVTLGMTLDDTTTIGELSTALLENNNGLRQGMQLSLVCNYQQSTGDAMVIMPRYYEITLAVGDTTPVAARMPLDVLAIATPTGGELSCLAVQAGTAGLTGAAFILSSKEGGVVNVSTQYMTMLSTQYYDSYITADKLAQAIASYGSTSDAFLTPGYGTNGGSDGGVTIPSSITRAGLNGTMVNVGEYLGAWGGEDAGFFDVTFNRDVDATLVTSASLIWQAAGGGEMEYTTGISQQNTATIRVVVPQSSTPYPSGAITRIEVGFSNGSTLVANFKATDEVEE